MTIQIYTLKGRFRDVGEVLTPGSLVLIGVPGEGLRSESGIKICARRSRLSNGDECIELLGSGLGFDFLPDEDECERIGLPVSSE